MGLPFDSWRPGQRLAIRTALHAKTRHVVLQAPTGAGKSTIAAALMQLDNRRSITLTGTKGLQEQYRNSYDWMYDIRGMGNYECLAASDTFKKLFVYRRDTIMCDEGPCKSGRACTLHDSGCTYFDAYRGALASQTTLTNYSYLLAMRRFGRGLGGAHRLILDEAHALPEELMSACRIEIPCGMIDGNPPETWKHWTQWAAQMLHELRPQGETEDVRQRRTKLIDSLTQLGSINETWAWDVVGETVVFEPTIPRLLFSALADDATCRSLVYLSATITPATLKLLNIDPRTVTFQEMRSRFDVKRRPIYLVDTVRVDHKMSGDGIRFWLNRIDKIIKQRLDRKGVIHTVSYGRMYDILKGSSHSGIMVAPRSASELTATVERFRKMRAPAVLISPSVTTGWDFPYTDCEYQILAKVPFPDTRSNIAKARIAATEGYREHITMQAIVQAAGRGMRADDDQCETFIIDNHAVWFLPMARQMGLSPQWFSEAVHRVKAPPPPSTRLT